MECFRPSRDSPSRIRQGLYCDAPAVDYVHSEPFPPQEPHPGQRVALRLQYDDGMPLVFPAYRRPISIEGFRFPVRQGRFNLTTEGQFQSHDPVDGKGEKTVKSRVDDESDLLRLVRSP